MRREEQQEQEKQDEDQWEGYCRSRPGRKVERKQMLGALSVEFQDLGWLGWWWGDGSSEREIHLEY